MLCLQSRTSPAFRPPETSVIAAGRAEGGAAHRHRDADCGAAQAANRRREPHATTLRPGDFAVTLGAFKIVRLLWDLDHTSLELPSVHS